MTQMHITTITKAFQNPYKLTIKHFSNNLEDHLHFLKNNQKSAQAH